jgi:hypothetical protein
MCDNEKNLVTRKEQIEMGLLKRPNNYPTKNYVALEGEVLPPVRHVPQVIDPYAPSMPAVQQVVSYEATPLTRAQAMTMKVHQVTIALAILTACALYKFSEFYLFTWLLLASLEWVGVFIILAIIDYRETPAAQSRMQWHDYAYMMHREQAHRLRAMYPEQYPERSKRK